MDWSRTLFAIAGFGFGPILVCNSDLSGRPIEVIERGGNMGAVAVARNVSAVAAPVASEDGGIVIAQRAATGRWHQHTVGTPGGVHALAWSASGAHLAAVVSGTQGQQLAFWETVDDIPNGDPSLVPLGPGITLDRALSWHPRRELLAIDQTHTIDFFSPDATARIARLRPSLHDDVWESQRPPTASGPDYVSRRTEALIGWQSHPDGRPTRLADRAAIENYWRAAVQPDAVFAAISRL